MNSADNFLETVERVVQNKNKIPAIIVDIDGTLAHMNNLREFYEWSKVGLDTVNSTIRGLVNLEAAAGTKILVTSGRDEECATVTAFWLKEHNISYDELFMRSHNDQRKDQIVKWELYKNNIEPDYFVKYVLDDRQQVVDLWSKMGLVCLQVAVSPD